MAGVGRTARLWRVAGGEHSLPNCDRPARLGGDETGVHSIDDYLLSAFRPRGFRPAKSQGQ